MSAAERSPGVTGIILAGGAGSRMGGTDKGLLSLQGRPLIEHVIQRIAPQVNNLIIVANRNLGTYRDYGHPVVSDSLPDYPGPLVGMLAGLSACRSSHALFIPADAARLPEDLAARLQAASQGEPAVATDRYGLQPLCCLMPSKLAAQLKTAIDNGERSPLRWLESLEPRLIPFEDENLIWSVNTPEELAQLQQHPGLAA